MSDNAFLVGLATEETRSRLKQLFQSPEAEIIYSPILYASNPGIGINPYPLVTMESLPLITFDVTRADTVRNPATGILEFVVCGTLRDEIYSRSSTPSFQPYFTISNDIERGRALRKWTLAHINMFMDSPRDFTFTPQFYPCNGTVSQHWNRSVGFA